LGRISKTQDDVRTDAVQQDGIRVLRRSSGGGTVLQGPGCLNYSLILSRNSQPVNDLRRSYGFILGRVVEALRLSGVESAYHPISDIALTVSDRKISGNAQKRGRKFILHHGTMLVDFDLEQVDKYLKMPKEFPDYRNNRDHRDFMANASIDRCVFKKALAGLFNAFDTGGLSVKEKDMLRELRKIRHDLTEAVSHA
jgi:lipoate-protein ligase A